MSQDTVSKQSQPKHIPITPVDIDLDELLQKEVRLTEIFYSLQGEGDTSGAPTIFIRLTGCPLRCTYCDTTYSFYGGDTWLLADVMEHIKQYPCKRVCVTGGEPLAQKVCIVLLQALLHEGYEISLETAGALPVKNVPVEVSKVMDLKTPSSGEEKRNLWKNIDFLTKHDQVKFVIMHREDYEWSKRAVEKYDLINRVNTVWFSPMFDTTNSSELPSFARTMAEWIIEDGIDVKLQLQLHKLIWADAKGK